MNKKQALVNSLLLSVPEGALEKAMIDKEQDPTEVYTKHDSKVIDEMAIDILLGMLSTPNISQGGYSISYDRNQILERIKFLSNKIGVQIPVGEVEIRAVSLW